MAIVDEEAGEPPGFQTLCDTVSDSLYLKLDTSKYCYNTWTDLRGYGPCVWDDYRKLAVVDQRVHMLVFEDEVPYFIDDETYFNSRNANPPDGYILLSDATSRESFGFVQRAVGVIVEGIREAPRVAREMQRESIAKNGKRRVDAGPDLPVRMGSKDKVQHAVSGGLLKALPWTRKDRAGKGSVRPACAFTCFPRLPMELQLAILRACLTSTSPVIEDAPHLAGINIAVLRVNRFFHLEGTKIYQTQNNFFPRRPIYLVADITWSGIGGRSRVVSMDEGRELAERYGCAYFESSSRKLEPVQVVVEGLVRDVVARRGGQGGDGSLPGSTPHEKSFRRSVAQRVSKLFD
ncbi:hypothetical protein BJY00DRAFT_309298 [Aspergillus carlsbadensis]|nr:hypothetical protein BJY00DRAFT_309298 [Aspergillus carlsbadensis]